MDETILDMIFDNGFALKRKSINYTPKRNIGCLSGETIWVENNESTTPYYHRFIADGDDFRLVQDGLFRVRQLSVDNILLEFANDLRTRILLNPITPYNALVSMMGISFIWSSAWNKKFNLYGEKFIDLESEFLEFSKKYDNLNIVSQMDLFNAL